MNANNGQTKVGGGRELSFFFIPAAVIAAFGLMVVGVVATLNHQPLTSSIETVLAGPAAPEEAQPAPGVAVAQAANK